MLFKQQKISKRKVDQINNFFFSFEKPNQQLYLFVLSKKKKLYLLDIIYTTILVVLLSLVRVRDATFTIFLQQIMDS